ncbi:MAG TPA: VanZ family protein [Verrucomicrobiae bacterium]
MRLEFGLHRARGVCSFCAVSRVSSFARYWLPVLFWMLLIFGASSDTASAQRSSRIIGPIVHWLFPRMPEPDVERIIFHARKAAHFTEFAVLAVLLWRAARKPRRGEPQLWRWSTAFGVFLFAVAFAVSDELHQGYVPTRTASAWDVLIDSMGAATGLLLTACVCRWLERRRGNKC